MFIIISLMITPSVVITVLYSALHGSVGVLVWSRLAADSAGCIDRNSADFGWWCITLGNWSLAPFQISLPAAELADRARIAAVLSSVSALLQDLFIVPSMAFKRAACPQRITMDGQDWTNRAHTQGLDSTPPGPNEGVKSCSQE